MELSLDYSKNSELGFSASQYFSCQHHILDRVLKLVLDKYLSKYSLGPNLNYRFVDEMIEIMKQKEIHISQK